MLGRLLNLFRRDRTLETSISLAGADMHAHWLPGIDDGAPDMDETLRMIRKLADLGVSRLIASPHVMVDFYPNSKETILVKLEEVRAAVSAAGLSIKLDTAAEYLIDEGFTDLLDRGELLTFGGKRVLVELSFVAPPPGLHEIFFQLLTKGYQPVLAHPERYRYYHEQPNELRAIHDKGVEFQVNLLSLAGHYGQSVRDAAERLWRDRQISFWGTDAHRMEHLHKIEALLRQPEFTEKFARYRWENASI